MNSSQQLHGLLLGTAVGDSVGLPAEGLSPAAIRARGWERDWQHRLIFGKGMWSDDTEHTLILAQALNHSQGDPLLFQKDLARGLKHWILLLPAGVGLATARAILKLLLGFSPTKSGVFSAGNGPCMRAAAIGVVFQDDKERRWQFNRIQTRITHTDPKAEFSSRAVVELAALLAKSTSPPDEATVFANLAFEDSDSDFRAFLATVQEAITTKSDLPALLRKLGANPEKGVSGYCYHSLAAVLHCGISHQWLPEKALPAIWNAGGDTDTTGAILGALCGTLHGISAFPSSWVNSIQEWPVQPSRLKDFAKKTSLFEPDTIRYPFHPLLPFRNFFFLIIVLGHGFLRLIPRRTR